MPAKKQIRQSTDRKYILWGSALTGWTALTYLIVETISL